MAIPEDRATLAEIAEYLSFEVRGIHIDFEKDTLDTIVKMVTGRVKRVGISIICLCIKCDIKDVSRYYKMFGINNDDMLRNISNEFVDNSASNYVEAIRWIYKNYKEVFKSDRTLMIRSLLGAVERGALETMKYLQLKYQKTTSGVLDPHLGTLSVACEYGRLDIAQWLYETYEMCEKDLRMRNNMLLVLSLYSDALIMADWLNGICQFTQEELIALPILGVGSSARSWIRRAMIKVWKPSISE